MKKQALFISLLMILNINTFSQVIFENGYFINDSNQKIECMIKNIDWKNNPTMFEYKLLGDSIIQKASIENVKEFSIQGVSKYIRATVKIDKSSNEIDKLSDERNPIFQVESLFLKVLVEGKASLFLYEMGNLTRFFYSTNDSLINQLVYKEYLKKFDEIGQNISFRQQLFVDLKCQGITLKNVDNINYYKKELEKLFVEYNECSNSEYINYEYKKKKDLFNLSFRPGINISNLKIDNSTYDYMDNDFKNRINLRFGIETEFILPFNKDKWAIIIEPTYQYYKSEKTTETNLVLGGFLISDVKYQSIELPIGVRHYFFLNNKSKVFASISYIFDFSNNSELQFTRINGSISNTFEIKGRSNFGLELGYKFNDKYSFGLKYQTRRELLGDLFLWTSNYSTFSVIFGYTLF